LAFPGEKPKSSCLTRRIFKLYNQTSFQMFFEVRN
jgi:hypothetical protein